MSRKNKVTLDDVALKAGVSAITVSRALRQPNMVSEPVRARINKAVQELGYVPNPGAQLLATGRSNVIGVVIPSVTNSVFSDVLRGIYAASENTRYSIQLANTRYSPTLEASALKLFSSQKPAGLVVAGFDQNKESLAVLEAVDCPVIQIMETGFEPVDLCVGFSHIDAARAATRHLIDKGYRKLGFLAARMDPRTQRRFSGFREVAEAAGVFSERRVVTATAASSVTKGGELLADLLAKAPDVDAIFCINDDLALGAMFEAQRRRIGLPGQLGICGFNDLEMMAAAEPSITSVHTPRYDMGTKAIEMILSRIAGNYDGPTTLDLGFEVVERMSTNRPASKPMA